MFATICDSFFFINILLIIYVIFIEHKNHASTWAWIMIMSFIPILGFVLYLFLGHDFRKRKMFSKKEDEDYYMHILHGQAEEMTCDACLLQKCTSPSCQSLMNLHLIGHQVLYTTYNHIEVFSDGKEKFKSLFDAIEKATTYIHLEYYIIHADGIGQELKTLLIRKAASGVKVRLLYDGMGCIKTPHKYFNELTASGVDVTCFYPPVIAYINLRINYRNHRKICIIDGNTAYLGGFNVGDEYLGKSKKMGYWRDTHLKIEGTAAQLANLQFLLDWRFATKEAIPLETYMTYPQLQPNKSLNVPVQIVSSGPDSKYSSIQHGYIKMITSAKKSILIQTPYFIPDEALLTALKIAILSGIQVKFMIPNKPDHMFVHWATYSYIGDILACGGKCYTYQDGFLHSKVIVIDEEISSVGTANFDIRSFKLNFEINAFIYDCATAKELIDLFNKDLNHCKELTLSTYRQRPLLIRIKEPISKLLSPLL